MWRVYVQNHPVAGRYFRYAQRQPEWIVKIALAAAALVILLPLLSLALLLVAALIVGVAVFLVLALLMSILTLPYRLFQALFPRRRAAQEGDGRENVVVLRPDHRGGQSP